MGLIYGPGFTNVMEIQCNTSDQITADLLAIGRDWDDQSSNPELERKLQNELSLHFTKCDHDDCLKSLNARTEVGIQTIEGVWLR